MKAPGASLRFIKNALDKAKRDLGNGPSSFDTIAVIMLAYRIVQELATRWSRIDLTVDEAIKELSTLCATEMKVKGKSLCNKIPEPRESISKLLKAANVKMLKALSCHGIKVATRKKLPERRKSH